MTTDKRPWLRKLHPTYERHRTEWGTNERRFTGGTDVLPELRRFDWETAINETAPTEIAAMTALETKDTPLAGHVTAPGQHYAQRQAQAVYLNFPATFMESLVGQLMRKAPQPGAGLNFGGLGEVKRKRGESGTPSYAELVYYNADGTGADGSQWDAFWADVEAWAGATGHRWMFVEASVLPGQTVQQVIDGNRPYLRHLSPLAITNWDYVDGRLAWAVEQLPVGSAKIVDGSLERPSKAPVRLYVRQGFTGFDESSPSGIKFSTGGWWTFDEKGELLAESGASGNWDKTKGEISLWPHFYQRDKRRVSRPGTSELGNAAVAYMNMDSAASFDAWDAASSLVFLLGVNANAFNIMLDKIKDGSRYAPVPAADDGAGSKIVPTVSDGSTGAVTAAVFTGRLTAIRESVREIAALEASSTADSSGLSKMAGFAEGKAPKLALMASEMETSQNIAIRFLELRYGVASPTGSVTWARDFDLAPVLDQIERVFNLEQTSQLRSPTLAAKLMTTAAREAGVLAGSGADEATVEREYSESARAGIAEAQRQAGVLSEFGRNGTDPIEGESTTEPDSTKAAKVTGQEIKTTEQTVLNGAQVKSAFDIVAGVVSGAIPRDSGTAMLELFFNLSTEQAGRAMGSAGTNKPTTPNPVKDGQQREEPPAREGAPAPAPGTEA